MAYLYPWGNTQQLNLDWILQKIKDLEAGASAAVLDEISNALLAASYAAQAYTRSDIVFHDGKLYRANQDIPAPGEAWTPAHWDEILLGNTVSNIVRYVAALSNDQIANSSSVSGTHTSDALDTLKNAIDGITLDSDSVSNESQVTGDSVSDALDTLNDAVSDVQGDVDDVSDDVDGLSNTVSNIDYANAQNVEMAGENLDDYTTGGVYYFPSSYSPTNRPADAGAYGFLVVIKGGANARLAQLWINTNASTNNIWMRANSSSAISWGAWKRIVTEADVLLTPKDLSSYATIVSPLPNGITAVDAVKVVQYGAFVEVAISIQRDASVPITNYNNGVIVTGLPNCAYKGFVGTAPIQNANIPVQGSQSGQPLRVSVGATGNISVIYGETSGTYRATFFYMTNDFSKL